MLPVYNVSSALIRFVANIFVTNPVKARKTIIDYDIAALVLPLNIFMIIIGSIINKMFPGIILSICLFLFIVFVTI